MSATSVTSLTPKNLAGLIKKGTPVKELIKLVKKGGGKDVLSKRDESGQTILHIAAAEGVLELIQYLVEKYKADIEEKDKNDWRPLHCATIGKKLNVMQYLLKQGANAGAKTTESATPLHYFAKIPPPTNLSEEALYQDVLNRLIGKSTDINVQNKSGQTPLHKAVLERTERTILITELLAAKANLVIADSFGDTAAHMVIRNGNSEILKKLLEAGGPQVLTSVSPASGTPYSLALSLGQDSLCSFIRGWAKYEGLSETQLKSPEGFVPANEENSTSPVVGSANSPQNDNSNIYLVDDPEDLESTARRDVIRRFNIVKELLVSEQHFVQQLRHLNLSFADPIKENCSSFAMSLVELNAIFNSELPSMYKKHRAIYETLKNRVKEWSPDTSTVGDIFGELHALRSHYKNFTAGAEESIRTCKLLLSTNPHFAGFVTKTTESIKLRNTELTALLLKPLERVCTYYALLKDLNKVTPVNHADKAHLELALDYATQISQDILIIKKNAQTRARIKSIEDSMEGYNDDLYKPTREFVMEETLLVKPIPSNSKSKVSTTKCIVFLFNDMLLWAKKVNAPASQPAPPLGALGNAGGSSFGGSSFGGSSFAVSNNSLSGSLSSFGSSSPNSSSPLFTNSHDGKYSKNLQFVDALSLKYISSVSSVQNDNDVKHAFEISSDREDKRFIFGCDGDDARLAWISRICSHVSRVSLYQMWLTLDNNKGQGPSKRVSHTATVVGSRLYIFGGHYQNTYYNDMYIFHLENREWTKVPTPVTADGSSGSAVVPSPRCEHAAVAVSSRIIYFGGFDGQKRLKDLYVFDTSTLKWTKPAIQSRRGPGGRSGHKMAYVDRLIWLFGGIDSHGTYLNDMYTLNLEKWSWAAVPVEGKMPAPRAFHTMDVLKNRLAVFGGYSFSKCHDDVAIFDTRKYQWNITSASQLLSQNLNLNVIISSGSKSAVQTSGSKSSSGANSAAANAPVASGSGLNIAGSGLAGQSAASLVAGNSQIAVSTLDNQIHPSGRYHHASFVVEDFVFVQGGLTQGTSSYCDLWALTTYEDEVVWHPIPVALQLDNRFRHTISAFKNKTSGKVQGMMFGGISGLATSTTLSQDVVLFKDLDYLVSSLNKTNRKSIRKVANVSKVDLYDSKKITPAAAAPVPNFQPKKPQTIDSRRSSSETREGSEKGSPVIGRDRKSSEGSKSQTETKIRQTNSRRFSSPRESLTQTLPYEPFENLPAFHVSMLQNPKDPVPEFKLECALDTKSMVWIATHTPSSTVLCITILPTSRANSLINNDSILKTVHPSLLPYHLFIKNGDDIWILQPLQICSAASLVKVLGITLSEASIALLCRKMLDVVNMIHKEYQSPQGICPEHILLSAEGAPRLTGHTIIDFIRDSDAPEAKEKSKKDGKINYFGQIFEASNSFISPELAQIRAGITTKSINSEKSDVYSIGLTTLYLFTGALPEALTPHIQNPASPAPRDIAEHLPPVGTQPGQISPAFREFLSYCLEANPAKRPLTKTLMDHSFISASRSTPLPDTSLVEYINLWKKYRSRGRGDGKPRDGVISMQKDKATGKVTKFEDSVEYATYQNGAVSAARIKGRAKSHKPETRSPETGSPKEKQALTSKPSSRLKKKPSENSMKSGKLKDDEAESESSVGSLRSLEGSGDSPSKISTGGIGTASPKLSISPKTSDTESGKESKTSTRQPVESVDFRKMSGADSTSRSHSRDSSKTQSDNERIDSSSKTLKDKRSNSEEPATRGKSHRRVVSSGNSEDATKNGEVSSSKPQSVKVGKSAIRRENSTKGSKTSERNKIARTSTIIDLDPNSISRGVAFDDDDEDDDFYTYHNNRFGPDDLDNGEDDDDDYGHDSEMSGEIATLHQLEALQEEYMEFQQSTAENLSKMAGEMSELRTKLQIAQNELSTMQADFDKRVEEKVQYDIKKLRSELDSQTSKEVQAKVDEKMQDLEIRFSRQSELLKHQLTEDFKSMQRDLFRFVGVHAPTSGTSNTYTSATPNAKRPMLWKSRPGEATPAPSLSVSTRHLSSGSLPTVGQDPKLPNTLGSSAQMQSSRHLHLRRPSYQNLRDSPISENDDLIVSSESYDDSQNDSVTSNSSLSAPVQYTNHLDSLISGSDSSTHSRKGSISNHPADIVSAKSLSESYLPAKTQYSNTKQQNDMTAASTSQQLEPIPEVIPSSSEPPSEESPVVRGIKRTPSQPEGMSTEAAEATSKANVNLNALWKPKPVPKQQ